MLGWVKALHPWFAWIGVAVGVFLLMGAWNRLHIVQSEAARVLEAEKLRANGEFVAEQEKGKVLEKSLGEMVGENSDLKDQLDKAKKASPGIKTVTIEKIVTEPGKVTTVVVMKPGEPIPCVLRPGDTGEIRIARAGLETRQGNEVVIGTAEFWRVAPEPAERLYEGIFDAKVSHVSVLKEEPAPRWGAGVFAGAAKDGWALGVAVAVPPLRLFGLQLEATLGMGAGPTGGTQGALTGIVRW